MEKRGQGRARGRARGTQPQQAGSAPRPGSSQGPPRQPQGAWGSRGAAAAQGPPAPSAWVGRGQPVQHPTIPQTQWVSRPPAPETLPQAQATGRGSRQGGGDDRSVAVSGETFQSAPGGDNGRAGQSVRGRSNRNEIINLRPHSNTKKGTDGTVIKLKANYFSLLNASKWCLIHYRVDFVPDLDDSRERRILGRQGFKNVINSGFLFDGTGLYVPMKLHPDPLELVVANDRGENYRITARMVDEVYWGDWHYLQLFNIIIRKCLEAMKFSLLGRNYFDPNLRIALQEHKLELWPGFLTSMRQYEHTIMLNADLSFKVLRTDNVYDLLLECSNSRNPKVEFQQRVIGSIVLTYYNNKTYRIDDVDFEQTPDSTFTKKDGSQISFRQYFQERYRLRISVPNQPLLISKTKPREIRAGMPELVILVPELCTMTGLSDRQRENFHLMKAMGEHTRVGPSKRMEKLREFRTRIQNCPEAMAELRRWDLQLAQDIVEFPGRILPQETLLLSNSHPIQSGPEADWTRSLRSAHLFSSAHLDRLAVICPSRLKQPTADFVNTLIRVGKAMNFNIGQYRIVDLPDDRHLHYLNTLEDMFTKWSPNMVLVVLQGNSADKYAAVKKKCYIDRAMPCQVIVGRNLQSKGVMSIATKVAIQMNCKLGGSPWGMSMPKNIMVVGYDVCRDTANRKKSFAGMVASLDGACSQYFSMTVEHEQEQEISSSISAFLLLACNTYKQRNHIYPERIIIYRDGVGDGQIPYVKEHEVDRIKEQLSQELYKGQPIKMAFVVVSKRINTKIFRAQPFGDRRDFNPPPGTVVDDVITSPERYDFFLVSQCVRQGTVAPTSYNVIEDTLGIDANRLQRFTFKLTHMYYNWSGTVRVPAPCQYAHKLAFLTAQSLHRPANQALSQTLYFL